MKNDCALMFTFLLLSALPDARENSTPGKKSKNCDGDRRYRRRVLRHLFRPMPSARLI